MYSVREQFVVGDRTRGAKVLHVPHYNVPLLYRGSLLVTIHDLTHLLDANYRTGWKSRLYALPMLKEAARRADHVFTVSEYSKRKLMELFRIDGSRISVIYNGVSSVFAPTSRKLAQQHVKGRFGLDAPFILYVGNLKPHKNVDTLMAACDGLASRRQDTPTLVLVGADQSGMRSLLAFTSRLRIAPRFISDAETNEVAQLYQAAEVLVMPSFEEGFGLPVVEAMACGTPVICSDRASLPEIAGDAAVYFDPHDVDQLTNALERVLDSSSLQSSLRARGLERAKRFTWRESAERHLQVYRRYCSWNHPQAGLP